MSGQAFKKLILSVGEHHSPDGTVVVTTDRLHHWANEFSRMKNAGQVVPAHWDHSSDIEELTPISMDVFDRPRKDMFDAKQRSAAMSVGKLADFKVAADGQSAEIVLETLTDSATEKVNANAVYVSPVIFPEWQDGRGNTYTDCITHMDLVNWPVDSRQGPFQPVEQQPIACAIRMGLTPTIYRLSEGYPMSDEDKKDDEPTVMSEDATELEDDAMMDAEETPSSEGGQKLADVLGALASMNIMLGDDTTSANLLDRLHAAVLTAVAHTSKPEEVMDDEPKLDDPIPQAPQIATMSVESQKALAYASNVHRQTVAKELDSLFKSGRCTPAEYNQQKARIGAIKLSLDKRQQPIKSEVERFIDNRKPVPKGTFWSDEQKTKRMSAQPIEQPESWSVRKQPTKAEMDEAVQALLRK